MKKHLLVIVLFSAALLLTGCTGFASLDHHAVNQTDVVLQKNNFKVVKSVEGHVTASYILGIGGYSNTTLRDNAIHQMFRNAELRDNQAVVNISTTVGTKTILGIYSQRTVTAYGTVVEFTN